MARKRTTAATRKTRAVSRPRRAANRKKSSNRLANVIVPLFFIFCLVFGIGFLFLMGYQSATASSFFDLQTVAIDGAERASSEEIERIVKANSVKSGVWNADIDVIKKEVEAMKFVKHASVSRVLPDKFQVTINERIPKALVRIDSGDYWVDEDGFVLNRLAEDEKRPSFVMFGWDQRKTETAIDKNKERVELFARLREEWQEYDLASRVRAIDLSDLRDPRAIVSDSGEAVTIYLGSDNFRKALQKGIENIAGRGKDVESIIVSGARPIIEYRDS
ncbi:MAG: FtsQ-type POTRA domain-containing protein [Pyrinomonadaceae bacterium]